MFDKLEKHHVGIIITNDQRVILEKKSIFFHEDVTQGTHVSFVMDNELGMYREYIVQEGRVAKIKPGFYHFCYNIPDLKTMEKIERFIRDKRLGYPVTKLEKSGSSECGWVKFYFLKNHGVIELNLLENPSV
ncbi:hypothetical protein N8264_03515 [Candidatus Thioglobus sp.]|nr:hypothetical protein [Candidatus Thioglobus sp.]